MASLAPLVRPASIIDQTIYRIYGRILLCFPLPEGGGNFESQFFDRFKLSVMETFLQFPELAARIQLKGEGGHIEYVLPQFPDEEFSLDLAAYLSMYSFREERTLQDFPTYDELARNGMPPDMMLSATFCKIGDKPDLDTNPAIFHASANFIRGGLVLALYIHHAALDGIGVGVMAMHLSQNFRKAAEHIKDIDSRISYIQSEIPKVFLTQGVDRSKIDQMAAPSAGSCPEFAASVPQPAPDFPTQPKTPERPAVVPKILVISSGKLRELKDTIHRHATECKHKHASRLSLFDTLSAAMWSSLTKARRSLPIYQSQPKDHKKSRLGFAINVRSRLGLPPTYIGNAALFTFAELSIADLTSTDTEESLATAALAVREANVSFDSDAVRSRLRYLLEVTDPAALRPAWDLNRDDVWISSWGELADKVNFGKMQVEGYGEVTLGVPEFSRKPWAEGINSDGACIILPRVGTADVGVLGYEVMVQLREDVLQALMKDEVMARLVDRWV